MKIYTKFGDQGQTRLVGGECVQKNNPRVEGYGTVDELNSCLGICVAQVQAPAGPQIFNLQQDLIRVQNELFNLGSLLACEKVETLPSLPPILESHIEFLELKIDEMTAKLQPLKNFILPGGSPLAAHLHLARTICRRAERCTVGLLQTETADPTTLNRCLIYLNRLSDYLFVAARFANLEVGLADQVWKK